jgi:hypothetical protein
VSNELTPDELYRLKEAIAVLTESVSQAAEKIAKETGVAFSDLTRSVQAGTAAQNRANRSSEVALKTADEIQKSKEKEQRTLKEAEEQLAKLNKTFKNTQEQQGKVFKTGAMLNQVFGTTGASTEAFQKQASRISQSLSSAHYQLDLLQKAQANGEPVNTEHIKTIQSQIKTLKSQEYSLKFVTEASTLVRNGFGQLGQLLVKQYQIEAQYQGQYMQLMSQGADGFQLLGAALNKNVDMTNASSQAMANFAQTAGQAMQNMGGKILPLVGLGLNLLGHAASAAADAAAQLAKQGIAILMAEGSKLIKTYQEMGQTGIIFGNGMQGMIDATHGTKLRLEEMAAVVKNNKEAFAGANMGLADATAKVGAVARILGSATGNFAKADKQLLALGYSYADQADMAAETLSMMSKNKAEAKPSNEAVAQATMDYAKNLSIMAQLTGEDMKAKKKTVQAEMDNLAFQGKLSEMPKKQAEALQRSMEGMSAAQRKAVQDTILFGAVRDKDTAITLSQNRGEQKSVNELMAAYRDGSLTLEKTRKINAQNAELTRADAQKSAKTLGLAAAAGVQSVQGSATQTNEILKRSGQITEKNEKKATQSTETLQEGAKTGKGDKTTETLLQAQELGATAAKTMQEIAVSKLPQFLEEMKKAVNGQIAALKAAGIPTGGGDKYSKLLEKYLPLILGALIAIQVGKGTIDTVKSLKSMFKGKAKEGVAESVQKSAPKAIERAERAAKFKPEELLDKNGKQLSGAAMDSKLNKLEKAAGGVEKAAENSKGLMGKVTEKFSSAVKGPLGKLVKGTAILGTVLNVGMAVKDVADAQKNYEKAKKAGDKEGMKEARAKQGESVGSAAGGVAGAALGTLLGGPIGTAIGGYLGAELGGMLGKYAGPYWDMASAGIGKAYDTIKNGITGFMKEIPKYFQSAMAWITGLPEKIKEGMAGIGKWLKESIKQLPASLKGLWKSIKDGVMGVFTGVGKIKWGDIFKGIGTTLMAIGTAVFDSVLAIGKGLFDIFTEVGPVLWDAVKDIGSWIWDGVKDLGSMMWDGIKAIPGLWWDAVKGISSWVWEGLKNIAPKLWDALKDTGAKLWEGVKDIGTWIWDGVKDIGSRLWDGVKDIGSRLWDSVKDIGTWIWDGVKNIGSRLFDTVKNIGNWIWDGIKNSPVAKLGEFVMSSLSKLGTWVWEQLGSIAGRVWDSLKGIGGWIWDAIKNSPIAKLGTWIFDAIKNSPVGQLGSWIGDMVMAGVGKVKEWMSTFMDWIKEKAQSLIPDWVKSMMGDKPKPAEAPKSASTTTPAPAPAAPAKTTATQTTTATAKPVTATPAQATPAPVQAGPKSPSPAPAATAPSRSVPAPTATPTEKPLTPEEKKDVNAAIATHTKYTNDLLTALKNDMGATNRQMIAQLAQLASYASNTADATKKIQKQGA